MAETAAPQSTPKSMAVPLTAFAVGAVVALLVGIFGRVHTPTLDGTTTLGFSTVLAMKTALTVAIGILVLAQLFTALWLYGKLGWRVPSMLGSVHRGMGATTLVLSVFVAYHCLWALGLEVGHRSTDGAPVGVRTVVHGLLGCLVLGAI